MQQSSPGHETCWDLGPVLSRDISCPGLAQMNFIKAGGGILSWLPLLECGIQNISEKLTEFVGKRCEAEAEKHARKAEQEDSVVRTGECGSELATINVTNAVPSMDEMQLALLRAEVLQSGNYVS